MWVQKLGKGTEGSHARMQTALNEAFPYALGMFEPSKYDKELKSEHIFEGETALQTKWLEAITPILERANLQLPRLQIKERMYGGRSGYHTEYLQPLLDEMTEVYRLDPAATW